MPPTSILDAQATGCFCELLPLPKDAPEGTRRGSVEHMHVVYADPGRVLRMRGGLGPLQSEAVHGTLTITLKRGRGRAPGSSGNMSSAATCACKPEQMAPLVDKVLGEQLQAARREAWLGRPWPAPTDRAEACAELTSGDEPLQAHPA